MDGRAFRTWREIIPCSNHPSANQPTGLVEQCVFTRQLSCVKARIHVVRAFSGLNTSGVLGDT